MIMMAIGSSLFGAALGLRMKVTVLFIVIPAGISLISIGTMVGHEGITQTLLASAIYAVAVQFGYLGGLFTRFVVAASRVQVRRTRNPQLPATDARR